MYGFDTLAIIIAYLIGIIFVKKMLDFFNINVFEI